MTLNIVSRRNGHLFCEDCSTYWCYHVEQYVRANQDVEEIWNQYPTHIVIEVPVVPTSNLWLTVILSPSDNEKLRMYRVDVEKGLAVALVEI